MKRTRRRKDKETREPVRPCGASALRSQCGEAAPVLAVPGDGGLLNPEGGRVPRHKGASAPLRVKRVVATGVTWRRVKRVVAPGVGLRALWHLA
ncbi:hypothetical protein QUB80_08475 [Chlorogloeopsis sp. ULAP01]|uniref:hypothetical protein n=1 Tax=Chlorogloeopsis sp. ULAP01 TaxID=3056483 RepID=UPI0025AA88BB|nr:hypothetical protein [Chlorogloeopsis sp. ULAP01]MDM9380740.1 hypothetical protein [Chlorogloeopsis sp. ULAP01]